MSNSDGILPSRDAGAQPEVEANGRLPEARPSPAPAPAVAPEPRQESVSAVRDERRGDAVEPRPRSSLEDRLSLITRSGGLSELPPDFGDAGGDWSAVRSDDPFAVLLLDWRHASAITPEITARHRDLLQKFWQDRLRSMSQGAARLAIVKKYGGADESERLVRSYPERIARAYEQLATRGGIESAHRAIVASMEATARARIDAKLEDFLLDAILQPEEVRSILDLADREGFDRERAAAHIDKQLQARGLVAAGTAAGATHEERLVSTAWARPGVAARTPDALQPKKRSLLVPLFIFSAVVVLVLLINAALTGSRGGPAPAPRDLPSSETIVRDTAPATVIEPPAEAERPAERVVDSKPAVDQAAVNAAARAEEEKRRARLVAEAQERARNELAAIRVASEGDVAAAIEQLDALDARLRDRASDFAAERVELATFRAELQRQLMQRELDAERQRLQREAEEQRAAERERDWEQRLAQIEALSNQGNYSGAKTLADQLLTEPDLPEPIAIRARGLAQHAVAELQKIFSGAKVKSKTGRSPRGQKP